jgi:hypothetical protein
MAIHDGVVWSRAAAKAVARGNCLENAEGQMPYDEARMSFRDIRVTCPP